MEYLKLMDNPQGYVLDTKPQNPLGTPKNIQKSSHLQVYPQVK